MASSAQAKQFIQIIAPIIQEVAKERGYKVCSPIIAQACIESAFGTSKLASKWHNYFGMKCGSSWKGKSVNLATKEEYSVGTLTTIRDNFRAYDSMEAGVVGYFDFVNTKRYANLKTAETPEEYLKRIKADGYATSSTYVNTNMSCIKKYDLDKYDWANKPIIKINPYTLTSNLLRRGAEGDSVRWLQYELRKHGYNIKVDGDFGPATEKAVKAYQKSKGLREDGIVGEKTFKALKGSV